MLLHTFLTKLGAKIIEDRVSPLNIAITTEYYNDSIVHYTAMHIYIYICEVNWEKGHLGKYV